MLDASDHELMARLRNEDHAAFTGLMQRYQRPLANYFRRVGASTDVEDLVQETFLRVYRYRLKYRPQARFTTFLYTLARNAWFDSLRRKRTQDRVAERVRGEHPPPPRSVVGPTDAPGLDATQALSGLDERLREIVVLTVMQGLSYSEAADILRIPVGTVKSRMFAALHELRRRFHEDK
ncbi:MAG: ECF RNA polymerase sigma-E factor [Verrucomicrobia bacterium ADurb.Bin345]|nr:MAG: ECF RNA polymerase sigma-E factor [Verrucomicrobia bacterium ADurb.Bin345]